MNGKGDKSRVTNFTKYRENYTKIFKKWKSSLSGTDLYKKSKKVEKGEKST
tara:strand:+ start:60 stop:212 length:153 start_codon:yes stop_codon:yes gene_type:complete